VINIGLCDGYLKGKSLGEHKYMLLVLTMLIAFSNATPKLSVQGFVNPEFLWISCYQSNQ
jgi:hypothetical protein